MERGAVNGDPPFRARCSRCSNSAFPAPDRIDLGADFRCSECGHTGKLVEFADVATLDAILEALRKRTAQVLGSTPGNVEN